MKKILFLLLVAAATFSSCSKKNDFDPSRQAIADDAAIQAYLAAHTEIHATKSTAGLYYQVITEGTGDNPTAASTVKITYKGTLLNGTQFDAQTGLNLPLPNTILGWQIGVPLVKGGGRILLIIPSGLGYANRANGSIPANSVLVFTIDLLDPHVAG
jgi:FKBP-type peptidyl-prolyl cis-trans isomerase